MNDTATIREQPQPSALSPTGFLGRHQELLALKSLMGSPHIRLITIMGPPGVGKSSLLRALLSSAQSSPAADLQVACTAPIELASASSWPEVLARLEQSLPRVSAPKDAPARADAWIMSRLNALGEVWIALDHADHLLPMLSEQLQLWLAGSQVRFIVTSRERHQLPHEILFELDPLELPDVDASPQALSSAQAVRLFMQRARAVDPRYEPDEAELRQIGVLVRRLDGLPLAIELAASNLRMFCVEELIARLEHASASRGYTRALEDELEQLWQGLDEPAQRLLASLSLLSGRFEAAVAESLCEPSQDALSILESLRDRSLIAQDRETRQLYLYQMIQRFCAQKLDDLQWRAQAQAALIEHYGQRAQKLTQELERQGHQRTLRVLARAQDAFGDLLGWILAHPARWSPSAHHAALSMLHSTAHLVEHQGGLAQRRALLGQALPFAEWIFSHGDAALHNDAALMQLQCLRVLGRLADEAQFTRLCEQLDQRSWPLEVSARHLAERARQAERKRRWDESLKLSFEAQHSFEALGQDLFVSIEIINRGNVAYWRQDYSLARANFEDGLARLERLGSDCFDSVPLCNLTLLCAIQNDHQGANAFGQRAIARFKQMGDLDGEGSTLNALGMLHYNSNDRDEAKRLFEQALSLQERAGNKIQAAYTHANLASVAVGQGDAAQAEHHMGAAESCMSGKGRALLVIHNAGTRADLCAASEDWEGMIRALDRALEREDIGDYPELALHWRARRGYALCQLERLEQAAQEFEQVERLGQAQPKTPRQEAAQLLSLHLSLHQDAGWPHAREQLARRIEPAQLPLALWMRSTMRTFWVSLDEPRRQELLAQAVDPGQQALCISDDLGRIRLPAGQWAELGPRRNVQRLLSVLLDAHPQDRACSDDELISHLWPDELIQPEAAANRLYNAVALLRATGLKPWLSKDDDGYRLSPQLRIERLATPDWSL